MAGVRLLVWTYCRPTSGRWSGYPSRGKTSSEPIDSLLRLQSLFSRHRRFGRRSARRDRAFRSMSGADLSHAPILSAGIQTWLIRDGARAGSVRAGCGSLSFTAGDCFDRIQSSNGYVSPPGCAFAPSANAPAIPPIGTSVFVAGWVATIEHTALSISLSFPSILFPMRLFRSVNEVDRRVLTSPIFSVNCVEKMFSIVIESTYGRHSNERHRS